MISKLDPSIDLAAIRDEWLAVGLATGPDDVELRDRSIDLAYRAVGLEPPRIRIMLRSPLEGMIGAWVLCQLRDQLIDHLRDQLIGQLRDQLRDQLHGQLRDQLHGQLRDQLYGQLHGQLHDQLHGQLHGQLHDQLHGQLRDQLYGQFHHQLIGQIWRCGYGSHDGVWLSTYWPLRLQLPETVARLEGLWGLARSTGWWWPFNGAVICTPRPSELHMADRRLHRDGGPALAYPDGFALYRLHGVRVPDWLATQPAVEIDPRKLVSIDNAEVRREFVRKVGIGRVLAALNARVVSSCGLYELLELDLGDGRRRPYLKMQNPSVDAVHIEGVHPNCKTVQEALNYRNGLTAEAIDDREGVDFFQQGDVVLKPRGATKFKSRPKILT